MADHFALLVNGLITESTLYDAIEKRNRLKLELDEALEIDSTLEKKDAVDNSTPKKLVECRICQDEDFDISMEIPCSCCGSLKYAHRRCVQRWCNEKGNTTCEICYQQFKPGYTAPPPIIQYGRIPLNFRRNFGNPQLIRMVPSDHQDADSDYDESSSRSLRWLAVAIIFMVLLILRHTLPIIINGPDCCFPLIILVVLRFAGFALLLYIITLALVGLKTRHNQNDASSESAPSFQGGQEQLGLQSLSHVIQVE